MFAYGHRWWPERITMTPLLVSGRGFHLPHGVHLPSWHGFRAPWGSWWALGAALRWARTPGLIVLALVVAFIVWRIVRRIRRTHRPFCDAQTRTGQRCTRRAEVGRRCWQHPVD